MKKQTCGIIGCGRVGRALSIALKNSGYSLSVLMDKNRKVVDFMRALFPESLVTADYKDWPHFDVLFIAVNDDYITTTGQELADSTIEFGKSIVAHTSGVLTSESLSPLERRGVKIASMHPVQTFSGAQNDTYKLRNSFFALEGKAEAINVLQGVIADIGGKSFVISPDFKPTHHLACVLASNYVITLMNMAVSLFEPLEIPKHQIKSILLPLMKNAVENISNQEMSSALTGPISRGDLQTVEKHINLLQTNNSDLLKLYADLGLETVKLARTQPAAKKSDLNKIEATLKESLK
jgi:predicted short-subunit dehydrogenase-like oxidoreductase (DUF2520 family)